MESLTPAGKPLAIPVVPAVVPPLSVSRDSSSYSTMKARRTGCAVWEGREPRARIDCRARAGIVHAAWCGYRSIVGRYRAVRPKGRSVRYPGCLLAGRATSGAGSTTRAPSALTSRSPKGTPGGSPMRAAQRGGNAPTGVRRQRPPARRNSAVVVDSYERH